MKLITSGTYKDGIKYELNENGVLTLSGSGKITSIDDQYDFFVEFPHYGYADTVKKIVLGSDVVVENGDYLAYNSFLAYHNLKNISVSEKHPQYSSLDGVLFSKDKIELICYPKGKPDAEYQVPQDVQIIPRGVFDDVKNLKNVIPPKGRVWCDDFFNMLTRQEPSIKNMLKDFLKTNKSKSGVDFVFEAESSGYSGEEILRGIKNWIPKTPDEFLWKRNFNKSLHDCKDGWVFIDYKVSRHGKILYAVTGDDEYQKWAVQLRNSKTIDCGFEEEYDAEDYLDLNGRHYDEHEEDLSLE